METSDWIALASIVVAIGTLVIAMLALSQADKTRAIAEGSNRLAGQANAHASDANAVALDANRISTESNAIARELPVVVAWNDLLVAVAAVQTLDPSAHEVGPPLAAIRTRGMLLVDQLGWPELDTWFAAEWQQANLLLREAHEAIFRERERGAAFDIEWHLQVLQPYHSWVAAFLSNLRRFRMRGDDPNARKRLTELAYKRVDAMSERLGWGPTPRTAPGIVALEDLEEDPA